MVIFHKFQHSSLSTLILQLYKILQARNYIREYYNFMQFTYNLLVELPKKIENG